MTMGILPIFTVIAINIGTIIIIVIIIITVVAVIFVDMMRIIDTVIVGIAVLIVSAI
jgi:hypothetical protein